jgi:predicted  nucleic acid-binding Zn-ribbon protein
VPDDPDRSAAARLAELARLQKAVDRQVHDLVNLLAGLKAELDWVLHKYRERLEQVLTEEEALKKEPHDPPP